MKAKNINAELSDIIKLLKEAHTIGSKKVLWAQILRLSQLAQGQLVYVESGVVLTTVESLDDWLEKNGGNLTAASREFGTHRDTLRDLKGDKECRYHAIVGGVMMLKSRRK